MRRYDVNDLKEEIYRIDGDDLENQETITMNLGSDGVKLIGLIKALNNAKKSMVIINIYTHRMLIVCDDTCIRLNTSKDLFEDYAYFIRNSYRYKASSLKMDELWFYGEKDTIEGYLAKMKSYFDSLDYIGICTNKKEFYN